MSSEPPIFAPKNLLSVEALAPLFVVTQLVASALARVLASSVPAAGFDQPERITR